MKNTDSKTGISYPYDKEYGFTIIFPVGFRVCFICGGRDHFNRDDCSKEIRNQTKRKLFFNYMWAHKPRTETKKRTLSTKINSNSPYFDFNNLNSYQLRINHGLKYYQPQNKNYNRETNLEENSQIYNTPSFKKKK